MEAYGNISGNSGVSRYKIEERGILVEFNREKVYRYTYSSAGKEHIEKMKILAQQGKDLSTYISRNMKGKYEEIVE